jgi:hypothetical protein
MKFKMAGESFVIRTLKRRPNETLFKAVLSSVVDLSSASGTSSTIFPLRHSRMHRHQSQEPGPETRTRKAISTASAYIPNLHTHLARCADPPEHLTNDSNSVLMPFSPRPQVSSMPVLTQLSFISLREPSNSFRTFHNLPSCGKPHHSL